MALEPLTALYLTSNIIQFIDFTAEVVFKYRGIQGSAELVLPDDQELELVASDIVRLSKHLEDEHRPKRETADEKSLHNLSKVSTKIANELLDRITKHRPADGTPHGKWRTSATQWRRSGLRKSLRHLQQD